MVARLTVKDSGEVFWESLSYNVKVVENPDFIDLGHAEADSGKTEMRVPFRMRRDQNFLDQPPFTWMKADRDIFPEEMFLTRIEANDGLPEGINVGMSQQEIRETGMREIIRAVGLGREFVEKLRVSQRTRPMKRLAACLTDAYKAQDESRAILFRVPVYLLDIYFKQLPDLKDYVGTYWEYNLGTSYDDLGRLKQQKGASTALPRTFVGYAIEAKRAREKRPWLGLEVELPFGSMPEEIVGLLEDKSRVNRYFRITTDSEAMN